MKCKSFKYIISTVAVGMLSSSVAWGQEATSNSAANAFWEGTFAKILVITAAVVIIAALIAVLNMFYSMMKMQQMQWMKEQGMTYEEASEQIRKESGWQRLMKKMTSSVEVEHEEDILLDHAYDGIHELDNKLPPWWVALFYITISFALVYMTIYHWSGNDWSSHKEFVEDVERGEAEVAAYLESQGGAITAETAEYRTDESSLSIGENIFKTNCVACHGPNGQGNGTAPNLTDDFWRHGCDFSNIFNTINNGVPSKGMISWGPILGASQVEKVASYVKSLAGSNPPNPNPLTDRDKECKSSDGTDDVGATAEEAAIEEATVE